jgi:hypothetical protein
VIIGINLIKVYSHLKYHKTILNNEYGLKMKDKMEKQVLLRWVLVGGENEGKG